MSKTTPAEVWDFTSAEAFIKAGRDPSRRPLKDGWNTQLVKVDDKTYDVMLHGDTVVRYTDDDHILIYRGAKPDFVRAARIQKYALGTRYVLDNTRGAWRLNEAARQIMHVMGEDPIFVYQPLAFVGDTLEFGPNRDILPTHPPRVPVRPTERNKQVRKLQRTYVAAYMKQLESGLEITAAPCVACEPLTGSRMTLGQLMNDPEHLFAHMYEGVFPAAMVIGMEEVKIKGTALTFTNSKGKEVVKYRLQQLLRSGTGVY